MQGVLGAGCRDESFGGCVFGLGKSQGVLVGAGCKEEAGRLNPEP